MFVLQLEKLVNCLVLHFIYLILQSSHKYLDLEEKL